MHRKPDNSGGTDDTQLQELPIAQTRSMLACTQLAAAIGASFLESLDGQNFCPDFVARIPIHFARSHCVIGLQTSGQTLTVAIAESEKWQQLDVISRFLKRPVLPVMAASHEILAAINRAYQQQTGQAAAMIERLDRTEVLSELADVARKEDLLDVAARAPVIKLVNLMLFDAVQAQASDVHVQPYEERLVVRMRVDGILYDTFDLPRSLQDQVISRVKVMGRMNIAEKRLAQDGRATVQVGDRVVDLRIAALPTSFGERIVIRLLEKSGRTYQLSELGMPPFTLRHFRRLIAAEHGLLLVTGPTGSGKTTTLYAALKELDCTRHNILTLEDPIEYQLEGVSQTQVSDKKGMTFASGLRSVLRQDPDIIMVGEIRDRETATMAIQSALTGHLVFSTLHTNDAASAVTRLLDLGIEPYLVASSLIGVLAQRLVRRVCGDCASAADPTARELAWLGIDGRTPGTHMRLGRGCALCRSTGYRGRVGIFELLTIDEPIRRHIQTCSSASTIKSTANTSGMRSLRDDGLEKVLSGVTTIEEVETVTGRTEASSVGSPSEDA